MVRVVVEVLIALLPCQRVIITQAMGLITARIFLHTISLVLTRIIRTIVYSIIQAPCPILLLLLTIRWDLSISDHLRISRLTLTLAAVKGRDNGTGTTRWITLIPVYDMKAVLLIMADLVTMVTIMLTIIILAVAAHRRKAVLIKTYRRPAPTIKLPRTI